MQDIANAEQDMGSSQIWTAVLRLVATGKVNRLGQGRCVLLFAASVPSDTAEARMTELHGPAETREALRHRRVLDLRNDRRREARNAAARARYAQTTAERVAAWKAKRDEKAAAKALAQQARKAASEARMKAAKEAKEAKDAKAKRALDIQASRVKALTQRVNAAADKYRGTAAPKQSAKAAPQIVGMDSAPRTVCQPCRGRYDPDPGFKGSLANLPFGVYAEPAGFVARALLEAA